MYKDGYKYPCEVIDIVSGTTEKSEFCHNYVRSFAVGGYIKSSEKQMEGIIICGGSFGRIFSDCDLIGQFHSRYLYLFMPIAK